MLWRAKSLDQEALKRRTYRYITYIKHKNSSQCLHDIYTAEKVQRLNTGNDFKITIEVVSVMQQQYRISSNKRPGRLF